MSLHRNLTDAQLNTNLFIREPGDDQYHDFPFARCKGCVTISKVSCLSLSTKSGMAALERVPNSIQQHVITERLRQKFGRSRLHGSDRHRDISMASDKYDWHVFSVG